MRLDFLLQTHCVRSGSKEKIFFSTIGFFQFNDLQSEVAFCQDIPEIKNSKKSPYSLGKNSRDFVLIKGLLQKVPGIKITKSRKIPNPGI